VVPGWVVVVYFFKRRNESSEMMEHFLLFRTTRVGCNALNPRQLALGLRHGDARASASILP
jgi:hypothetical protein